ncbi:MAG: hypothetical protein ACTSRS_15820 [Candidatus Helarchaeota archaeon]
MGSERVKGSNSKDGVSPADVHTILALPLQNETGYEVYAYFLCDVVGETDWLGLAADILALIPFDVQAMANDLWGHYRRGSGIG